MRTGDRLFSMIFLACTGFFILMGLYLQTVKPLPAVIDQKKIELYRTRFMIADKKETPKKAMAPVAPAKPAAEKPIDLTKPAVLGQKENEIVRPTEEKKEVERVYGLRKVYSVGLGAGENASEAVIGKLGNTIEKEIDTITATKDQLAGKIASVTTVTKMPVLKVTVKPAYTDEMRKNGVSGVIKVRILIGADGKVRDIVVLNDLGFGSKEAAAEACKKLEFEPALEGDKPVAVWIAMKFKFVLTE